MSNFYSHTSRAGGLPIVKLVGWDLIKTHFSSDKDNFAVVKKSINNDELRLMVSLTYPDAQAITKKINEALQRIKDKGIYSVILKKYNISE